MVQGIFSLAVVDAGDRILIGKLYVNVILFLSRSLAAPTLGN